MSDFLNGMKRTCMCGELRSRDIGREVTIMGWVVRRRDLGNLVFVQIRDKSGVVQAVFDSSETEKPLFDKALTLRQEFVVAINGVVRARVGDNVNKSMDTGEIEIVASSLKVLSEAETPPFAVGDDSANETLRLRYRYLDLRREKLQKILSMRSRLNRTIREYMYQNGFTEVETPMLGKSTPEGARDYLVPSPRAPRQVLRAAPVAAAVQAAAHDRGDRQVFPDSALLQRRGFARQQAARIHAARRRNVVCGQRRRRHEHDGGAV